MPSKLFVGHGPRLFWRRTLKGPKPLSLIDSCKFVTVVLWIIYFAGDRGIEETKSYCIFTIASIIFKKLSFKCFKFFGWGMTVFKGKVLSNKFCFISVVTIQS